MKKIINLSLLLILLLSCSSNNEDINIPPSKDPVLGTWYLYSREGRVFENYECIKGNKINFSLDSKVNIELGYEYNLFNNLECVFVVDGQYFGSVTFRSNFEGTWENKGDNVYFIKEKGSNEYRVEQLSFNDDTFTIGDDVYKKIK